MTSATETLRRREITHIRPGQSSSDYWRRLWHYRELLWFLCRRDFVVKYRQTLAGILWLLARPLQQVFIFTVLFGVIAQLPSGGVSYPVLVMSSIVVWQYFQAIVQQSTTALTNNSSLITKVSFPRLILPVATVAPNLIDLGINLLAFAAILLIYGNMPGWQVLLLPVPLLLATILALGMGMWFGAAGVRWRDFHQLGAFVMTFFYMLSPLGFSSQILQDRLGIWAFVYYLNPLVGIIDLSRWCLLPPGTAALPQPSMLIISFAAAFVLLWTGQRFFRASERVFADVI
jgi:lipopolysaccharide transport system permease protein